MRLTFLSKIQDKKKWKNHVGLGVSIPTGSINNRDVTPMSSDARLGYAMQNGTGTYDTFLLLNNLNEFGKFKVGEQFLFKLPVSGKNDNGYKYGEDIILNLWVSYRFFQYLSGSLKINYQYKGEMKGFDNQMNKRMSSAMDPKNIGFNKVNLGIGFNFINNNNYFKNNRLAMEVMIPLYRDYKGIQMADSFSFMLGWQY
jgi:small nuclear ribonucleoprotein (snRNP)-like protein